MLNKVTRKHFININENRVGFTLAEVLITLGIIGVVAAMTIPTLMTNYKAHKLRTRYLKAYSIAQQAFRLMEGDDVSTDPSTYRVLGDGKFYKTYMKYFQAPFDCGYLSGGINNSKLCYNPATSQKYKSLDGKAEMNSSYLDDGSFALQDGTLFMLENQAGVNRLWVSVDINGYNNPPNHWGYDLFTFDFQEGVLRTMGDDKTAYSNMNLYCNPKISSDMNGIACAQKAKSDSEYFKKLVKEFK